MATSRKSLKSKLARLLKSWEGSRLGLDTAEEILSLIENEQILEIKSLDSNRIQKMMPPRSKSRSGSPHLRHPVKINKSKGKRPSSF